MKTILLFLLITFAVVAADESIRLPANRIPATGNALLGKLTGANFNSTADQGITINASKYVIRRIIVTNASTSLTLAVGGFYAAASKTTALVANTQLFSALTAATKFLDCTLLTLVTTDVRTEATLYLSLTVAQGGAATADIYIFGEVLP